MKNDTKNRKMKFPFFSIRNFLFFFVLSSFMLTSCILMFINMNSIDIDFHSSRDAAIATLCNVAFLSLLFSIIGNIYRKATEEKTLKLFIDATEKIKSGDFSVRIKASRFPVNRTIDVVVSNFNRMVEELGSLGSLRDDFIANVSHELKTPLAVIQNYATLLQDPDISYETRMEYTKVITTASRNLSSLITNILKLNKIENQQIYPDNSEFDLGEQIRGCILNFEDTWEKNNIDIIVDVEDNMIINGDAQLLELVWNNLFSNAFKFTNEGGMVSVRAAKNNGTIIVDVTDSGCGMKSETVAHIFEKFYQGDESHSSSGNGLGLALVKRVIDIVGGEIEVTSEPGEGSTFSVYLKEA